MRCVWCGVPCDKNGIPMGDDAPHVNGQCCPNEDTYIQVSREMALDAQDTSLEGEWIKW